MGLYTPDTPEPRSYADETRGTLQAQIDLAPDMYAAEASDEYGRPAYARLDLQVLRDTLLGRDGEPGLLELYETDVMPRLSAADAAARDVSREADIAAVERLGPRATEAFRASNPQQAALQDEMNRQAMEGLQAGGALPPSVAREIEQNVRGAQAARGFGYGMADIGQEALVKGLQGEQLLRRNQQYAGDVSRLNMATTLDPFLAVLGKPGVQINQGMGAVQQGQGFNPGQQFNPESAYAGSLYANNFNAANNAAIAATNARAGVFAGGMQALGQGVGSYYGSKRS